MLAFLHRILDWFKNVFWKEEMELALVGLQNSGKTTFVNVISVRTTKPSRIVIRCVSRTESCTSLSFCVFLTLTPSLFLTQSKRKTREVIKCESEHV